MGLSQLFGIILNGNWKLDGGGYLDSFLAVTGRFSVMIGTLFFVFGSFKPHSHPTKEMYIYLRPIPNRDTRCLFLWAGQLHRNW